MHTFEGLNIIGNKKAQTVELYKQSLGSKCACGLPWKQWTCAFIMDETVQERETLGPDRMKDTLSDAIKL